MIELSKKIAGLFLRVVNDSGEVTTLKERYKQFRINLLIAITLIALFPATTLAVLGYFQYLDLAQKQSAKHIRWHLEYVTESFHNHLDKVTTTLSFFAYHSTRSQHGNTQDKKLLFKKTQLEIKGLRDIEVIELPEEYNGFQPHPPTLFPENGATTWIRQALSSGTGISNIYDQEEGTPYFILAHHQKPTEKRKSRLIMARIDASHLAQIAKNINAGAVEDIFFITSGGALQSPSSYLSKDSGTLPIAIPSDKKHFATTSKSRGMGNIFYASTPIANTPWILVLIKDGPVHKKEWLTFQLSLFSIFFVCAICSFFIIRQLVDLLTIRIRESDTKRMALLNEVGHTNRLATIGKLAAGVAHEINNPLAVIDQKAGLIEDILEFSEDFSNKEKLLNSIEGIHTSVERCKIITHRLLGFARKMDSDKEVVNINTIVDEVMGFLEKEALYSHIIFQKSLTGEMPEIFSDKGQLQQIFLNIISNAMDAIGQNGIIRIRSSITEKEKILVEINDNGPGIKPNVMEHIFDPFFTTKETGKGTGLGLSITYGLVKKLGGDIKVYSKVGEGVTFYIYLPIHSSNSKGE